MSETCCARLAKKSPSEHHRTTLLGYIFATKAHIDNQGTPANFNGFRVLAVLLHSTLVVGISQILRCRTEGATYIRQGGHHVGHWPTFLVSDYNSLQFTISVKALSGHIDAVFHMYVSYFYVEWFIKP